MKTCFSPLWTALCYTAHAIKWTALLVWAGWMGYMGMGCLAMDLLEEKDEV